MKDFRKTIMEIFIAGFIAVSVFGVIILAVLNRAGGDQ